MTAAEVTSVPMSEDEVGRLVELESVIEAGMDTFIKVGTAVAEIRNSKLYRATHSTFEAYVVDRWEMSRRRAYQLIEAARVCTTVLTLDALAPQNERQVRPLVGLNDPEVREAWQKAVEQSAGKPTAADVTAARNSMRNTPFTTPPARRKPLPDAFRNTLWETSRKAESLAKLVRDDRWSANLDTLRVLNRGDLRRLIDSLETVYNALGTLDVELPLDEDGPPEPDEPEDWWATANKTVSIAVVNDLAEVTAPSYLLHRIRVDLAKLGATFQTHRTTKRIQFPARYADDLADWLKAGPHGLDVQVLR